MAATLLLSACSQNPLRVTRSACPAVAVPIYVGSVTRFDPPLARTADAIDVTAQLSDVSGTCIEGKELLTSNVAFTVTAQRRNAAGARQLYLPVFIAIAQGGNVLVSKKLSGVTLEFADRQARAEARGGATVEVHRSAVTLPAEVQAQITRERRPEEADALIDPLADPKVRAALRAASFEVLVGFQMDDASLAYNVSG